MLVGVAEDGDTLSNDAAVTATAVVPFTRACRRETPGSEGAILVGFFGIGTLGDDRQWTEAKYAIDKHNTRNEYMARI